MGKACDDTRVFARPIAGDDLANVGEARAFSRSDRAVDFGLDLALDAIKLAMHDAIKPLAHYNYGIASLPMLDFAGIAVTHTVVVSRTDMAAVPVGLDLNEMWSLAGTDCRDDSLERTQQELAIVTVELLAR